MNIFYLNKNQKKCAAMHLDKHCIKMILEYAQLLSTAHRVLDGEIHLTKSKNNRNIKRWTLNDMRDKIVYQATHINHPCAIWARENIKNYLWLAKMLKELCLEYTFRYGKTHKIERTELADFLLLNVPKRITKSKKFLEPPPTMPEKYITPHNSIASYQNYYNGEKRRIFSWKNRPTPDFIKLFFCFFYFSIFCVYLKF